MKRLIPALACILAALLIGVGTFMFTSEKTKDLSSRIDRALNESDGGLYSSAQQLFDSWEDVQMTFGAFLKHSDADELAKLFYKINDCVENKDEQGLREALGECRTALRVIIEGEKLDVANVF